MEKYFQTNYTPLKNICRICLENDENNKSLFLDNEDSKAILNKIYLCFRIVFNPELYLPVQICSTCIEKLNSANDFRLKCITFEERFKEFCKQNSIIVDELRTANHISNNTDIWVEPPEDAEEFDSYKLNATIENNSNKIASKSSKNSDEFKCDICNKILKTSASLLKHNIAMHQKRKHVGKITGSGADRRYHCTKCTYFTPHSQTLVNHMRKHNGERPYKCKCGKTFTQSSSLTTHQKTHSNEKYFTCSTCGKQFKHAFSLKTHLRVHSDGQFTCEICNKILKSHQSLLAHIQRHYNIRNYNCEDCGATFVTSSELLNHKKKHGRDKFECHLCGYKTYAKKNLILHLKRHTGDRSYKCNLCEATMYTCADLRRHKRVHTREKPFTCPTCSQRFAQSSSLNSHMRNIHGILYKWSDHKPKDKLSIKHEVIN